MDIELGALTADEVESYIRAVEAGFGHPDPEEQEIAHWSALTEVDRHLVARSSGEIVGTAGAHTFQWTVPGPALVPAAGVTAVTVRTDARRRGVLTRMMEHQLRDVAARGEPLAILEASEAVIYGRFGYGLCTTHARIKVHSDRAVYRPDAPSGGRVRMVGPDEAGKVLPRIHDRVRRTTVGDLPRPAVWWEWWLKDLRALRRPGTGGGRYHVVHETPKGQADGYAAYRVQGDWGPAGPQGVVHVEEVTAESPAAYAALWRHLLDVDLTRSVTGLASVDEPLRLILTDPRQLTTVGVQDFLWTRILDVPAALSARHYAIEGSLVLEVADTFGDRWAAGRFELVAGPDGASCRPTRKRADLELGVAELGSVYLGVVKTAALARAGRVVEVRKGALRRADAMFAADAAPYTRTHF